MVRAALVCTAAASALASQDSLSLVQQLATVNTGGHVQDEEIPAPKDWNMCNSDMMSNLGGLGGFNVKMKLGHTKTPELRYMNVAKFPDGRMVDLVVTNTSGYLPNPANPKQAKEAGDRDIGGQYMNGRKGCLGRFNIKSPGDVKLKFTLAYGGTNTPIPVEHPIDFTVFDFDTSERGMAEQITVKGMDSWVEGKVKPTVNSEGAYVFTGDLNNVNIDNPEDRYDLTPEQMNACVGLVYPTAEWEIGFGAIDTTNSGDTGGRNFMFAGRTLLQDKGTPKTTTTTTCVRDEDGVCVVYSDPHIDGFDNPANGPFLTRVSMFDAFFDAKHKMSLLDFGGQGAWNVRREPSLDVNVYERGDFWLVKNDIVQIQGRYDSSVEFGGGRSGLSALAVSGSIVGGGKLLLEPKRGQVNILGHSMGPRQQFTTETAGGVVHAKTYYDAYTEGGVAPGGIDITLPAGISLQLRRYNTHLDAKIRMPHSAGRVDGQCGNFNGDPHDDTLEEIEGRISSMRVAPSEMLFAKPLSDA